MKSSRCALPLRPKVPNDLSAESDAIYGAASAKFVAIQDLKVFIGEIYNNALYSKSIGELCIILTLLK